jgi:signal transduction histidine kinase
MEHSMQVEGRSTARLIAGRAAPTTPARTVQDRVVRRQKAAARRALRVAGIRAWDAQIFDARPFRRVQMPDGRWQRVEVGACIHPDDIGRVRSAYRQALVDLRPFQVECRVEDGRGGYGWSSCWCSIVPGNGTAPSRLVVLERAIQAPRETLAAAQAPAAHDRSEAEPPHLDAELMAMISHELRSPVTTILGNARLLRLRSGRLTGEDRVQALTDIDDAADRVCSLIDEIMQLSHSWGASLDSDRFEPFALAELVQRVGQRQHQDHPDRELVVHAEDDGWVWGVPSYEERIVDNLVTNAIKYSPTSEPVEIAVDRHDGEVNVHVLDRGIGIEPDERQKLFTLFYRSARACKAAPGNGIGLVVCKRLAEMQGGNLRAAPRLGGGSEFTLSLPSASLSAKPQQGAAAAI